MSASSLSLPQHLDAALGALDKLADDGEPKFDLVGQPLVDQLCFLGSIAWCLNDPVSGCAGCGGVTWFNVVSAIRDNDVAGCHLAAAIDLQDPGRITKYFKDELSVTITGFVAKQLIPRLYNAYVGIAPTTAPFDAPSDASTTAPSDASTSAPFDAPTTAPSDASTTATSEREINWNCMFNKLVDFKNKHGHTYVRRQEGGIMKTLREWVRNQRKTYSKVQSGKVASNSTFEERVRKLTEIGFDWNRERDSNWNCMFEQLVDFKHRHGHTCVPQKEGGVKVPLGEWVWTQRKTFIKVRIDKAESNPIFEERVRKLTEIGFDWISGRSFNRQTWACMFELLKEFKRNNGHTRVAQSTKLGRWVSRQRHNLNNVSPSDKRVCQLNEIGFEWGARIARPFSSKDVAPPSSPAAHSAAASVLHPAVVGCALEAGHVEQHQLQPHLSNQAATASNSSSLNTAAGTASNTRGLPAKRKADSSTIFLSS